MTFEKMLEGITFNTLTLDNAKKMLDSKEHKKTINYFINRDKITKEPMEDGDIQKLNALVNILQILYNSPIDSPISDSDYDTLQEMLIDMGIPRLTGTVEINDANKVNHKYTSLRGTLDKVYYLSPDEKRTNKSRKYLDEWIKKIEALYKRKTGKEINLREKQVILGPKFDGASCVLEAEDKMTWLTKGDTKANQASDVSHIMNIFDDLYRGSTNSGVKFEVMMTEDNKDKINSLFRNTGRKYKNSRQIVTAILNSNEIDFKADYLYPVPLRIMEEGEEIERIHPELLKKFPSQICKLGDIDTIKEFANNNKWVVVNGMRFRTDGAVITLTDPKLQAILGRDNDINNFEVAYKFTEEYAYSKVKDIEFYVSEFAYITPVLVVYPVNLKGNTIDHISLSNYERFRELDLSYGDTIKVLYDIIPYATLDEKCSRVKNGRKIEFVNNCPKCHEPLEFMKEVPADIGLHFVPVVEVQCKNPKCPSRLIGKVLNYCSSLRIQNIGYSTLETLWYSGLLEKGIRSLYKLKKKTFEIEELEGFGKLKTRKIIGEIEAKRRLRDYDFFGSIGIETLSIKTFKGIFSSIPYNEFMNMIKVKNFDLMTAKLLRIDGIAEGRTEVLVSYLRNSTNRKELEKLLDEVSIQQTYGESNDVSKGKIVFTGCRPSDELIDQYKKYGWELTDSWSNKAKYLVVPNKDYESTKVTKAKNLNITILTLESIYQTIPHK